MLVKQSVMVFLIAAVITAFCTLPSAGSPAETTIPDFTQGGQNRR